MFVAEIWHYVIILFLCKSLCM